METRFQLEESGSIRDVPTAPKIVWQWHHATCAPEGSLDEFATLTPRQCHLPAIEEILTAILVAKLGGSGNSCHINSAAHGHCPEAHDRIMVGMTGKWEIS